MHRPLSFRSPLAVLLLAGFATAQATGPEADLKHKSVDKRLDAIDDLGKSDRTDLDKLLLPLLSDKDWEIQERAAKALGATKCKPALKALVELAVEGDVVRIRRAAAFAAGAVDAAEAANLLFKKLKGKHQVRALEALALTNRGQPTHADADKVKKLLRDESAPLREAAAVAWLECAADRAEALRTLLAEPFLVVRCRALDAVAQAPRAEDLQPLTDALRGPKLDEVVERRLVRALAAVLATGHQDPAGRAGDVLNGAGTGDLAAMRRAQLAVLLARGDKPVFDPKRAVAEAKSSFASPGAARATAAKALREIGGDDALAAALAHWPRETDRRVQLQLVETVAALRTPTTPEAVAWLTAIATGNFDDAVRERAIVRLGKARDATAAGTLVTLLGDSQWTIACVAAVSLGKTKADNAFEPLSKLLQHAEWTHRGAGVVGLMHWNRAAAFELLIGMLGDQNQVVAGAAHAALQTMSLQFGLGTKEKAWRTWWDANKATHQFVDRSESIDNIKKYGYAVPDTEIYQGLDVIVFASRGDHIEQLLDRLKIAHRQTEKGQVPACGIHPEGIFVSNCTGEIDGADLLPLSWFVRTGGSLFGSCWALSETIERIQSGVMQKARTRDQVLDEVRALPVREDSPLLTGVFPPSVVPIYHLEGAHLIEVLDPERCEVLIDSPDAAERWGCGNLAAWFFCGHGVLFDSANHFDLQGLETQKDLKTAEERQAYAIDHMGLTFDDWRASRTAGYWKQAKTVGDNVPDLSAFRLLTNFVRSKRMAEY